MLHNNRTTSETTSTPKRTLHLLPSPSTLQPTGTSFLLILSRRCSSFFAEAAVLVLVFGILDYFMLKGRIELAWIAGAVAISLLLLAASITMDFTAQSWTKAHP